MGTVHGDAIALIGATAAEVAGIDTRRRAAQARVELGDEAVGPLAEGWLEAAARRGEVCRSSLARHVDDAGRDRVGGDAPGDVGAATAQIRGIDKHGVDDQRLRAVVRRHLDADAILALEDVVRGNGFARAIDLLIGERLAQAELAPVDCEDEVPLSVHFEFASTFEYEREDLRVTAGSDDEVIL